MNLGKILPILWLLLICLGSVLPIKGGPGVSELLDMGHILSYANLTSLWIWSLRSSSKGLLISLGCTPITELLQLFIPWRSANVLDVFNNAIGALLGYSVFLTILWLTRG